MADLVRGVLGGWGGGAGRGQGLQEALGEEQLAEPRKLCARFFQEKN